MAALQHLAPDFIREGRLCWLHSPLYIVTNGTKENYYYTDEEFDKVRGKITGTVTRAKGLGELSPETAKASMFTVGQQRLEVLSYSQTGIELLNELMGDDPESRRNYIVKNIDFSTIRE